MSRSKDTLTPNLFAAAGMPMRGSARTKLGYARARARRLDPETSHQAAASIKPEKLRESQRRVLEALFAVPGHDEAILVRLEFLGYEISPSGARTRRSELVARGLARDTGRREALPSGRKSIVWGITEAGKATLAGT